MSSWHLCGYTRETYQVRTVRGQKHSAISRYARVSSPPPQHDVHEAAGSVTAVSSMSTSGGSSTATAVRRSLDRSAILQCDRAPACVCVRVCVCASDGSLVCRTSAGCDDLAQNRCQSEERDGVVVVVGDTYLCECESPTDLLPWEVAA